MAEVLSQQGSQAACRHRKPCPWGPFVLLIDEERFLAILADPGKAGERQGTAEIVQDTDADKPKPKSKPKKSGSAKTQGELGNVLNP